MKSVKHIFVEDYEVSCFNYEVVTPVDALVVFPEARKIVEKLRTKCKKELNVIHKEQKKVRDATFHKVKKMSELEFYQELAVICQTDTATQLELEQRISDFDRMLKRVTIQKEDAIPQLKEIPITDFIEFNRSGFASCIWHNERTASLKYYPRTNTVYCFGCQKSGDTIDVVQKLQGFDRPGDAIKYLKQ